MFVLLFLVTLSNSRQIGLYYNDDCFIRQSENTNSFQYPFFPNNQDFEKQSEIKDELSEKIDPSLRRRSHAYRSRVCFSSGLQR